MEIVENWAEIIATIFLVTGIFVSIFSENAFLLYLVCSIVGLFFGRVWFRFKGSYRVPISIIIVGFFIGVLFSSAYADVRIIVLTLFGGTILGYWLHEKQIIRSIEY